MNVLVINCGSSSLKYQLINSDSEEVLAKGLCERIGIDGSQLVYQKEGCEKEKTLAPMPDSYIRKRGLIRKSQRHLCQHIKRPSRWYSMHL